MTFSIPQLGESFFAAIFLVAGDEHDFFAFAGTVLAGHLQRILGEGGHGDGEEKWEEISKFHG